MAFPVSPVDGQISTVNNIRYVYAAATTSWTRLLGTKYVAAASAPSNPNLGDQWYDTGTDALYEYINDGTTSYWVDVQSAGSGNLSLFGDSTLQGNMAPGVDSIYSIGSSTGYLKNIYANTAVANVANITAANITTATVTSTATVGNLITTSGIFWANGVSAVNPIYGDANVAAYLPTFSGTLSPSSIVTTGNVTISGIIFQQNAYYEKFSNLSNTGGNLTCDFNNGTVFNVTGLTANVTANFININAINNGATGAVVLISQSATAYKIANVQINGTEIAVRWVNGLGTGTSPLGLAGNTDIVSFSIMHLGTGNYRIFGQLSSFA